jgi:hypothetical protein
MTLCFLNNVYLYFLLTYTSYGLQPLNNRPFNALKAFYRSKLSKLTSLTNIAPVNKVNFIRYYIAARKKAFTEKNIKAGFRTTRNWPISRAKALRYPEI